MKKNKFYVVWEGVTPGIYTSWTECKLQVNGYEGAKYKSFKSEEEAKEAYYSSYWQYIKQKDISINPDATPPILDALSVDAACSGNPGIMEYRGVYVKDKKEIFKQGPFQYGTNNVGEFLALVHGLALLKKENISIPIYSDSETAIKWVKSKKCKTKLKKTQANEVIFDLIRRAENWLMDNQPLSNDILKWETKQWGEIPADFNRK